MSVDTTGDRPGGAVAAVKEKGEDVVSATQQQVSAKAHELGGEAAIHVREQLDQRSTQAGEQVQAIGHALGSGVEQVFSVAVDTGTFDELRIRLHKPEDNGLDPADAAFLAAHPDFAGISIRATGTWNGNPFTFTSDLDADQEMGLDPPLVVTDAGANVDVTLKVDVTTWVADGAGGLVDPATAGQGGQNENQVRDNIQHSFDAFQDEDHDGQDDGGSHD